MSLDDALTQIMDAVELYAKRIAERHNLFSDIRKSSQDVLKESVNNREEISSFTYSLFTAAEMRMEPEFSSVFSELVEVCMNQILLRQKSSSAQPSTDSSPDF